jgi:hypothetical protein
MAETKVEKSLIPKGKRYENIETREDWLQMKKEIANINDKNEVKRIIDRFLAEDAERIRLEKEQKRIDKEAKKRDEAAGMYGGGMGKARTGHTDYRKGGMVYTRKNK